MPSTLCFFVTDGYDMDFIDEIKSLASRIPTLKESICTEEATKNALVMPMINILGYNVFDPTEVIPEFTADHGTKKGEKVDYAIFKEGKPIILIECKPVDADLNDAHASQLFRYFTVTDAKVGILTNGVMYRFYSDLEAANKMDEKPFLEIDLLNLKENLVEELKRFKKERFDIDELISVANELKYTKEIKQILLDELNNPSEAFVRFFAKQVYDGVLTPALREKFTGLTKSAFNQFINDRISERLKIAMVDNVASAQKEDVSSEEPVEQTTDVITTEDEKEAYYIVKAILHENTDLDRVFMRDAKRYCAILLDDNNRKPICRLYFNTKQKYIGIFNENREEEKQPINNLSEIYGFSDKLKNVVRLFDENAFQKGEDASV